MQIIAKCPKCDAGLLVQSSEAPTAIRCGGCGREVLLGISEAVRTSVALDCCPVCSGGDFYIRKDFDPKIGLMVIVSGALASAVFYWFGKDLLAYSVLGGAALIDLLVYGRLKDVSICYRCHSEFRGDFPRKAVGFDLHTADVLELEYERRIGRR
jgi:hypothetical protein